MKVAILKRLKFFKTGLINLSFRMDDVHQKELLKMSKKLDAIIKNIADKK